MLLQGLRLIFANHYIFERSIASVVSRLEHTHCSLNVSNLRFFFGLKIVQDKPEIFVYCSSIRSKSGVKVKWILYSKRPKGF
ncbi:hypothetical protein F0562_032047 [Nyssa sinensis]|uniref:Uncharacterized protein n=1 Tax=Nyssa sinensis TaxID=561372 RepID=A0A5J5AW97_9ASTE|nr:hypothetical protein F0562_032047 [Nyssa sinensis]